MPILSSSSSSKNPISKPNQAPRTAAVSKKKRVVKRRGRVQNGLESDDEIEREAHSDSDSQSSAPSSVDSETEPFIDSKPLASKPTTKPDSALNKTVKAKDESSPFILTSTSWSEMVADEKDNGPADLPVIDFKDVGQHLAPTNGRKKPKKPARKLQPASEATSLPSPPLSNKGDEVEEIEEDLVLPAARQPPAPRRVPPGQSARQAYQERLDKDPSYVPTVGEFWGHDDRLMDKDLRSLSGWWRGRWQGRGRGFAMRGRGGLVGGRPPSNLEASGSHEESPADKEWTHDGFEEMKRNEQRRREAQQEQRQQMYQQPFRGGIRGAFRGRANFFSRGGFRPSTVHPQTNSPSDRRRVWYAMKPQLMWTKQHDGFLHYEAGRRENPTIRVKLPGSQVHSIRPSPRSRSETPVLSVKPSHTPTASVNGSDYAGKTYVVSLPKQGGHAKESEAPASEEDAFVVRPRLVHPVIIPLPGPALTAKQSLPHLPDPQVKQQLEQISVEVTPDAARSIQTEEAVLRNPSSTDYNSIATPPHVPSSPAQAYGSPYAYVGSLHGMPPYNMGMAYDPVTGLYMPPPPPHMFNVVNARPMMHHQFTPAHVRHHSTVEFAHHPGAPPPISGFIDPETGVPIFTPARQSSAIQIRDPKSLQTNDKSTSVKSSTQAEPSVEGAASSPVYPSISRHDGEGAEPSVVPYPFQPQYYYPGNYGYAPYLDMSPMGQYGDINAPNSTAPIFY